MSVCVFARARSYVCTSLSHELSKVNLMTLKVDRFIPHFHAVLVINYKLSYYEGNTEN